MTKRKGLYLVGLLGGVASGKSTVAAQFQKLGARVLDADHFAHEALGEMETKVQVRAAFGKEICSSDGELDKEKIAALVFQDKTKRKQLENIIHPRVRFLINAALREFQKKETGSLVVLDVPLLLEGGFADRCDSLVFVDTPSNHRSERAGNTRGWTQEEWELREKSQIDLETKKQKADFIIQNSGSLEELQHQVEDIFHQLQQRLES